VLSLHSFKTKPSSGKPSNGIGQIYNSPESICWKKQICDWAEAGSAACSDTMIKSICKIEMEEQNKKQN